MATDSKLRKYLGDTLKMNPVQAGRQLGRSLGPLNTTPLNQGQLKTSGIGSSLYGLREGVGRVGRYIGRQVAQGQMGPITQLGPTDRGSYIGQSGAMLTTPQKVPVAESQIQAQTPADNMTWKTSGGLVNPEFEGGTVTMPRSDLNRITAARANPQFAEMDALSGRRRTGFTADLAQSSGAEALNKLFPGRETAQAMYGMRTIGQASNPELAKVQERNAMLNQAKTIEDKQALQRQFQAEDVSARERTQDIAGRQALAETAGAAQVEVAKAAAMGDMRSMMKLQNDYAIADEKNRSNMRTAGIRGIMADDTIKPADKIKLMSDYMAKLDEMDNQTVLQSQATQAGGFNSSDMNDDGRPDTEAERNSIIETARRNIDKYNSLTPEIQARHASDPAFIRSKAIIDQMKRKANMEAKQVIG